MVKRKSRSKGGFREEKRPEKADSEMENFAEFSAFLEK